MLGEFIHGLVQFSLLYSSVHATGCWLWKAIPAPCSAFSALLDPWLAASLGGPQSWHVRASTTTCLIMVIIIRTRTLPTTQRRRLVRGSLPVLAPFSVTWAAWAGVTPGQRMRLGGGQSKPLRSGWKTCLPAPLPATDRPHHDWPLRL